MYNKAIVAMVLGFLAPLGLTGSSTLEEMLTLFVSAVITTVGVYFTRNSELK